MIPDKMNNLEISEKQELDRHEAIIERGLTTFYEVGTALLAIRDKRLYQEAYGTFEEYCREKWKIKRNYANKLIQAAEVAGNLGTTVPIPESERHIRELSPLKPEAQAEAWQKALETAPAGRMTAEHIHSVVDNIPDSKKRTIRLLSREIRKEDSLESKRERMERFKSLYAPPLNGSLGKFPILYADPPWQFEQAAPQANADPEDHYDTMTLEEIKNLPVQEVAEKDCALFLWVPTAKVIEASEVLEAWGFTYRTHATWDKEMIGMGRWFRQQIEDLFFAMAMLRNRLEKSSAINKVLNIIGALLMATKTPILYKCNDI